MLGNYGYASGQVIKTVLLIVVGFGLQLFCSPKYTLVEKAGAWKTTLVRSAFSMRWGPVQGDTCEF